MKCNERESEWLFTDLRDGQKYRTVKIGTQIWMAENLNFNADGSKCYDERNSQKYGRLYNWETAMNACPVGWHLPSDAEWNILTDFVGGEITAGTKLKATSGWNTDSGYIAGTDNHGFAALPGGNGFGGFNLVGYVGFWWSATQNDASSAWLRYMLYSYSVVDRGNKGKSSLYSVRCVRD